jgi:hypothetical protein
MIAKVKAVALIGEHDAVGRMSDSDHDLSLAMSSSSPDSPHLIR